MNKFKYLALFVLFLLGIMIAWNGGCARVVETKPTVIPDTGTPTIVSVSPTSSTTGVPLNAVASAGFSEAMDVSSINTSTFTLSSAAGQVAGTVDYDSFSKSATFTSSVNLTALTTYTATVADSVKDLAGNKMLLAYNWFFVTGSSIDTSIPSIEEVTPLNSATGVNLNASITAVFTKTMDSSTINSLTFVVSSSAGNIAGSMNYENINYSFGNATRVTFTPSSVLDYNKTYTVTIASSVKDSVGNQMGSSYSWSFTTTATASAWTNVGSAGFSASEAQFTSLAADGSILYIAYKDFGNGKKASVQKFNGSSWEYVGSPGFSSGEANYTALFIENGNLYIAYADNLYSNQITVKKYNGATATWENMGNPGSANLGDWLSLYVSNGVPYVGFEDYLNSGKATVIKYNSGVWDVVGGRGFTAANTYRLSLFVNSGNPYLSFSDSAYGGKLSVVRLTGSTWESVGSSGFSLGALVSDTTSLKFDNGIIYVAYADTRSPGQAGAVMKYSGSSWVNVGSAGLFAGDANYPSLAFYNGTPYVAFVDGGHNYSTSVMEFNGTNWSNVGNPGFSAGQAEFTSLVMVNGVPYVGFEDYGNGKKATVMKYTQ